MNQNIEELQFADLEQLDLSREITLQIVKKPVILTTITLGKRFILFSKQMREIKVVEKIEYPKVICRDAKDKKVEATVEQELTKWK